MYVSALSQLKLSRNLQPTYSNSAKITYSAADMSHVTCSTFGLQQTWQSST